MKRKMIMGMICITLLSGILTGCCISHDWQEATCIAPKTCAKCGKTEGKALGHTWTQATCTEPKTCSVCGESEGEPLGHNMTEANYQQPSVCKVCGETVGEPLQADFDKYGISCTAELDTEYPITTVLFDDVTKTTTGNLTLSDYATFDSDDTHKAIDGYVWHTLTITTNVDILGTDYAFMPLNMITDYYDVDGFSNNFYVDENTNYFCSQINFNGENYTVYEDFSIESNTIENGFVDTPTSIPRQTFRIGKYIQNQKTTIYIAAPEGYDGIVVNECVYVPDDFDENGNVDYSRMIYDFPQDQIIGSFRLK